MRQEILVTQLPNRESKTNPRAYEALLGGNDSSIFNVPAMNDPHPNTSSAKRKSDESGADAPSKIARLESHQAGMRPSLQTSDDRTEQTSWTYDQRRPVAPKSGRRIAEAVAGDMVAILRFYGSTKPAMVDQEWVPCLKEEEWLSSNEASFYCFEVGNAYVEGAPGRGMDLVVFHSDTWGLGKSGHNGSDSLRHRSAPCPLEYKYIAFPANDTENHFFLCLILWPSDLLIDINPIGPVRTTAIILNSLASLQPDDPHDSIRRIIGHLSLGRTIRQQELRKVKVHMPQVSNQFNLGLFAMLTG